MDSALLLPGLHDAPAPADPRTAATYRSVIDELVDDGFVYRFRHDARPLHTAEGAFLLCGFWLAQAARRVWASRCLVWPTTGHGYRQPRRVTAA